MSRLRNNPVLALGCLLVSTLALNAQEHRLEDFDLEKVDASYVVSVPPGHDAKIKLPVILDFHGAIAPSRKGANVTRDRLWSKFVATAPYIVVGINGRTRAWGMTKGKKNDLAYARRVLAEVEKKYPIDRKRVYLAGFSSGSDFLCSAGLQLEGNFLGTLVVCPGPPNVVGLKNGALLKAKDHPFYFATGEEDYIRKDGAWQAFLALDKVGARVMYREVPKVAHTFFDVEEYARLLEYLRRLSSKPRGFDHLAVARAAIARGDFLLATTHLQKIAKSKLAQQLLTEVRKRGEALLNEANKINGEKEPGRAYEFWWRLRTQFHRFKKLADRAQEKLVELKAQHSGRDLYRARREWFRQRRAGAEVQRPRAKPAPTKKGPARVSSKPWTKPRGVGHDPLWSFNKYLTYDQIVERMRALADRFPERVRMLRMGKSIQGRDLWVLEITDQSSGDADFKPAAYVQGGIHGNEISTTMTVLYAAYQLAANPGRSRTTGKLLATTTFYAAPMVNPDAVHAFLTEPQSYWRPRFNYRPFDSDRDGKIDEDPYEDLNGDGEIGLMYQPQEEGDYIVSDGRLKRGKGKPRYKLIGREGIDNDGDGRYSEDLPGGIDLNRNFPIGFNSRTSFGGTSGPKALSEPETRAIVDFVKARRNISLFLDYHNSAKCMFYWTRPDHAADQSVFDTIAERAASQLGYEPKPLDHEGGGLSCAWAYGGLGLFSYIVELEPGRGASVEQSWGENAFMKATPFRHPQLGEILIGNDYRKVAKRNPHPRDILWQADRNWQWLRQELRQLPQLELRNTKIEKVDDGFIVTGELFNKGALPTDSEITAKLKRRFPIILSAEGGAISGDTQLPTLGGGKSHGFQVRITKPDESVTLSARHPRGGVARLPILRPKSPTIPIRRKFQVQNGYATPDLARKANNAFYRNGVAEQERGPAFELRHRKTEMKVAVLLGEWRDQRHSIDASEFEKAFFSRNSYTNRSATGQQVYGSLSDFYDEMSYGGHRVTGRVFDWVELPGAHADYRDASFGSRVLSDAMLRALRERDGADALDGYDGVAFIWAGSTVNRVSALWPMRLNLKQLPGKAAFKMAEYHQGEMSAIGVACHEMGHTFGVNDKYGLGATVNPLGPWCLMAKGTHGGGPSARHRPFHLCAWCKSVIGWVKPAVIDPATSQKLALRPVSFGPGEAYRVLLKPDGSEYLLLENRRREGFHTDLPSPGLVVLRVGPNDRPASPQTRVQLIPAHGLPPLRRGVIAKPSQIAWPQTDRTALEVDGVSLINIRLVDDVVYFETKSNDEP